jgi:hypothetical protein
MELGQDGQLDLFNYYESKYGKAMQYLLKLPKWCLHSAVHVAASWHLERVPR